MLDNFIALMYIIDPFLIFLVVGGAIADFFDEEG